MLDSFKKAKSLSSWLVFIIALTVYFFSAERTGSLWDVGEFILGAYKLEVVHPPGAPLFMLIGRIFAWVGDMVSSDPATIAFAVNMLSGVCGAFGAFLIARITMMLGRKILVEKGEPTTSGQNTQLALAGVVAGLSTAFCSSIWFSAAEGEVYAMSTFFTILTLWAAIRWYELPDTPKADKWLVFTAYSAGLSIGVHLLSLLTLPAIGMLYYNKKWEKHNLFGYALSFVTGAAIIVFIQKFIIAGIPALWHSLEIFLVNSLGMPFHSGLILTLILIALAVVMLLRFAHKKKHATLQLLTMSALMVMIGFSTIGIIVIRANADTPINMNVPSDATRILPYLNREQYGERALLYGPHFDAQPKDLARTDRYGRVGDEYKVVDQKLDYVYNNRDKMIFPRIGHSEGPRPQLHREWHKHLMGKELKGRPSFLYNIKFMLNYQMGWMYWRYFMWNFAGRQNASQGFSPWDKSSGHWQSGITPIDEWRLHETSEMTDTMKNHKGRNSYYFLPLIFGIIGLLYHARQDKKTFAAIFILFLITGLGLILYSNQPPNEPRERDYVLVGSFFTFCIWIGLSVLAISKLLAEKVKLSSSLAPIAGGLLVLSAPLIMAFQNFDDHSRLGIYASRDYAANFLNSVDKDAIIFTYGDNDTYPLWYAQEVENIRRDVRVVNLSLIAVDWYIEKLTRKVNDSAPLKLTIPITEYRGNKRNQVFLYDRQGQNNTETPVDIYEELKFIGSPENVRQGQTIMRSKNFYIPINPNAMVQKGLMDASDLANMTDRIEIKLPQNTRYITKDQLAVMDVVASNIQDRKIYFAVTCKNEKLLGLNDYMQMEGLGLRIIPVKSRSVSGLSIYGSGRVDTEKTYDNIMNKWKWGNLDKKEAFVDESYAAELQAMKIVMMRTAQHLQDEGQNQKAAELSKEYLESFPHFNFPWDESVIPFVEIIATHGDKQLAKKYLGILAEETRQKLAFFDSLDDDGFQSFRNEYAYAIRGVGEIIETAKLIGDQELSAKIQSELGAYNMSKMRN